MAAAASRCGRHHIHHHEVEHHHARPLPCLETMSKMRMCSRESMLRKLQQRLGCVTEKLAIGKDFASTIIGGVFPFLFWMKHTRRSIYVT